MSLLTIDGRPTDLSNLWRPEKGLNRIRREWRAARYSLLVDESTFTSLLIADYEACVLELKRDDAMTGKTDFFGEAGYPPLSELMLQPELLAEVVDTYFSEKLFSELLPPPPPVTKAGTYAIGGVDRITSTSGVVTIEGTCYT